MPFDCPSCLKPQDPRTPEDTLLVCRDCQATYLREGSATITGAVRADGPDALSYWDISLTGEFQTRYRLSRVLGAGSFAIVFLATRVADERPVAIKFLTRVDEPGSLARFMQESRLMAQLEHPRVVRQFELDELNGHPYIVTEYLEGGTLTEWLAAHPRPPLEIALPVLLDCLEGLEACHVQGVVHRDLKPANILFTRDGRAKLADFGVARSYAAGERMTLAPSLIGTPRYMAPEQLRGEDATTGADLHAMGLIAYELLAGFPESVAERPPEGTVKRPRPIREVRPDLPEAVEAVIMRALSRRVRDRPASAAEMAGGLKVGLRRSGVGPVSRRGGLRGALAGSELTRGWRVAMAVALLGALALGAAGLQRWKRESDLEARLMTLGRLVQAERSDEALPGLEQLSREAPRSAKVRLVEGIALGRLHRLEDARRVLEEAHALAPANTEIIQNLAQTAVWSSRLADAESWFLRAAALEPDTVTTYASIGEVQLMTGRPAEALENLRRAEPGFTPGPTHHVRVASALKRLGRVEEATRELARALELAPQSGDEHALAGAWLEGMGMEAEAGRHFDLAATRPLRRPELGVSVANWLLRARRFAEAEIVAGNTARALPRNAAARGQLAAAIERLGRVDEALRMRRKTAEELPQDEAAHLHLGHALSQAGDPHGASTAFAQAAAANSRSVQAAFLHGLGLFRLRNDPAKAEPQLRRALQLDPSHEDAHAALVDVLAALGRREEAEASMREALARQPRSGRLRISAARLAAGRNDRAAQRAHLEAARLDPVLRLEALTALAELAHAEGKSEAAVELMRTVLAAPGGPSADRHNLLAMFYLALKQGPAAGAELRKALALNPSNVVALLHLSEQLRDAGQLAEAEKHLTRLAVASPNLMDVHFQLGKLCAEQARLAEAERHFQRALALKPGHAKVQMELMEVHARQGKPLDLDVLKPAKPRGR